LDDDKVCRFNCAAKFGEACTECTEAKCICSEGQKWNGQKCAVVEDECDANDKLCSACGKGFDLIDVLGKCKKCSDAFGAGCKACTKSKCTEVTNDAEFKLCGAKAVAITEECPTECSDLFPGCKPESCTPEACNECSGDLVLQDGFCSFNDNVCSTGQLLVNVGGTVSCGTCKDLDENCIPLRCTGHGCTLCKVGYALSSAGTCFNCTKTFPGCGLCHEDACTKCLTSSNILTPNGCFSQSPYVPEEPVNVGLIVGCVIGGLAVLVLIILAVYCIVVRSQRKHGLIDPSIYEDDLEFKSVSVL